MNNYLTCEDVAIRYGVKVRTVWKWIREKKLPAHRLGGKLYKISDDNLKSFEEKYLTVEQ